jgi:hypothetical protein
MGVRFIELSPDKREEVVGLVRTVAYLRDEERGPENEEDAQA